MDWRVPTRFHSQTEGVRTNAKSGGVATLPRPGALPRAMNRRSVIAMKSVAAHAAKYWARALIDRVFRAEVPARGTPAARLGSRAGRQRGARLLAPFFDERSS